MRLRRPPVELRIEDLSGDLLDHLFRMYYALDSEQRHKARWVMNDEWFLEVRKLMPLRPSPKELPLTLLMRPVEIRPDGGAPHLEVAV